MTEIVDVSKPKRVPVVNDAMRAYVAQVMAERERDAAFETHTTNSAPCELCRGLRFVSADVERSDPRFGKTFPCPKCNAPDDDEKRAVMVMQSGLTSRELTWTMDGWAANTDERRTAAFAIERLVERRKGWLTLWGPFGPGKSYLGCAATNAALALSIPAMYWVLADLLDALKSTYRKGAEESFDAMYERITECPFLVIDECHVFNNTEWAAEKFRQIVTRRYRLSQDAATLWIMNAEPALSGGQLPGQIGFLYSKMREFDVLKLSGDMRAAVKDARRKRKTGPLGEQQTAMPEPEYRAPYADNE